MKTLAVLNIVVVSLSFTFLTGFTYFSEGTENPRVTKVTELKAPLIEVAAKSPSSPQASVDEHKFETPFAEKRRKEQANQYKKVILPRSKPRIRGWEPRDPRLARVYRKVLAKGGVSRTAAHNAFRYYEKNKKREGFNSYIVIADYSKRSSQKRMLVINTRNGSIEKYRVAHGKGSDWDHNTRVNRLSSRSRSRSTPPGFHKMKGAYYGRNGLSVRMYGLERRNKTSLRRAIVMHGARYMRWRKPGRSWGCLAVNPRYIRSLSQRLKSGALVYNFHKDGLRKY